MASSITESHLTQSEPHSGAPSTNPTVLVVLFAISFSHLLNDTIQSLIPAIYPLLKTSFHLSFVQVGLITLAFQMTASILQPIVGWYTDRRPKPYSLACGMGLTLGGLVLLSHATHYAMVVAAAALVGMGSSVFHPESSRVAHLASGGRHGFAQSLFQVGGNAGSSLGPLLAALIGIGILSGVGRWYGNHLSEARERPGSTTRTTRPLSSRVWFALAVLGM